MKKIVRKDPGKGWKDYTQKLAKKAGLSDPTDNELRQFDRKQPGKKLSYGDWETPSDPDARITRVKNGTTRLAYKAEHAVDLDSDIVVSATVHPGAAANTATLIDTAVDPAAHFKPAGSERGAQEIVADKGCYSVSAVTQAEYISLRTYIPERQSPTTRRWVDKNPNVNKAVYAPAGERRAVEARSCRGFSAKTLNYRSLIYATPEASGERGCEAL